MFFLLFLSYFLLVSYFCLFTFFSGCSLKHTNFRIWESPIYLFIFLSCVCFCFFFLVSYIRRLCLTQDQCCNYCFKRSCICPHVYHFWYSLCIPMYQSPFILKDCLKIFCRSGLSFCLFGNILISPLFVKNFTAHRILGLQLTFALWICNSKAFGLHCLRIQMLILTMVHYMLFYSA